MEGEGDGSMCSASVCSSKSGRKSLYGPLQSMTAREELRRRRREELKAKYENAKKQKEDQQRVKLENENQLEKLQRKAYIEQKKIAAMESVEKEKERQKQHQLWIQQMELASLHCLRRRLKVFGISPWKKMMQLMRKKMEQGSWHYRGLIQKKIMLTWFNLTMKARNDLNVKLQWFRLRWCQISCLKHWFKYRKMSKQYHLNLVKRCVCGFKETLDDRDYAEELSVEWRNVHLYKVIWNNWSMVVKNMKTELFLKNQVASRHAYRWRCERCFREWKAAIKDELCEKKRSKSRSDTWSKINNWLHEYHSAVVAKKEDPENPNLNPNYLNLMP